MVAQAKVSKGTKDTVPVVTQTSVGYVVQKGSKKAHECKIEIDKLRAPVKQGQRVGMLHLIVDGTTVEQVPLIAQTGVDRANFFQGLSKTVKKIVTFGQG